MDIDLRSWWNVQSFCEHEFLNCLFSKNFYMYAISVQTATLLFDSCFKDADVRKRIECIYFMEVAKSL